MSEVHIITVELIIFLVGFAIAAQALYRPLRLAWQRPLPRILAGGLIYVSTWVAVYFSLLLAVYYGHLPFNPNADEVLVAAIAAAPWIVRVWWAIYRWRTKRQPTIEPDKEQP